MWKMGHDGNDDGDRNPDGLSTDILLCFFFLARIIAYDKPASKMNCFIYNAQSTYKRNSATIVQLLDSTPILYILNSSGTTI